MYLPAKWTTLRGLTSRGDQNDSHQVQRPVLSQSTSPQTEENEDLIKSIYLGIYSSLSNRKYKMLSTNVGSLVMPSGGGHPGKSRK